MTLDTSRLSTPLARTRRSGPAVLALLATTLLASGCVTPWERSSLMGGRDSTIDNVQGPTERNLRNLFKKQEAESYANGSLKPLAGTEAYLAAEKLYEDEQYAEASKAFHKVARKYKKSEIKEDAVFMEAEAAYQLGHYAHAQDKYSELLRDFPSTRHLDIVSKRLFETARLWLDFPEAATLGEVAQVNYDNFGEKLPAAAPVEKKSKTPALWPNLTDKSRPLFDPEGNGVGALRLIWLNDPTGPLADDALMLAASHYSRTGNYIEADRHYTLLREEYPNSPHVQNAFVLGSHVKLMSYEGPDYDSKSLEDSKHLKESILRLYPSAEDRPRVEAELRKIEIAEAARVWGQVVFYEKKNNPRAQSVYCHLVIQRFPETPYAEMARERLKLLGPEHVAGGPLLSPQPDLPKYKQTFGNNRPRLTNTPSSQQAGRTAQADASGKATVPTPSSPRQTSPSPSAPAKSPAAPRRFFPWAEDGPASEKESPADTPDQTPVKSVPQQVGSSEQQKTSDEGSRWPRMLRFTPPSRLTPARDAKPISEDAGKAGFGSASSDATETERISPAAPAMDFEEESEFDVPAPAAGSENDDFEFSSDSSSGKTKL